MFFRYVVVDFPRTMSTCRRHFPVTPLAVLISHAAGCIGFARYHGRSVPGIVSRTLQLEVQRFLIHRRAEDRNAMAQSLDLLWTCLFHTTEQSESLGFSFAQYNFLHGMCYIGESKLTRRSKDEPHAFPAGVCHRFLEHRLHMV